MNLPILRFHKSSRQYYVWLGKEKGRLHFGSDPNKAKLAYAEWLADHGGPPALPPPSSMTVADAVEAFRRHAKVRYTRPSEQHRYATAITAVAELYGNQPASTFRAKALRDVRTWMLSAGKRPRSRNYVNKLVRAIQTAWRWLAAEELVPAECATSVCMVRALAMGEGGKERPPVLPPDHGAVAKALPYLPAMVQSMVQIQLLTGARPGEICRMRWEEVSRDPAMAIPLPGTGRTVAALRCGETMVWMYAPGSHKTLKRGKSRVVAMGPQAMAILLPWLRDHGPVFLTRLGTTYRADSYSRAVARACLKANIAPWHPNQLRHAAATEIAEQFDSHHSAAALGHAPGSNATTVYVEQSLQKAAAVAAKIG